MPIKLAVLNDYPIIVAGLEAMLEPHADRIAVTQIVLNAPAAGGVDVVLLDNFADRPLHALARESTTESRPKVVVFGWDETEDYVRSVFGRGADGYVPKSATVEELVDAIERVHRGERLTVERILPERAPPLGRWPGEGQGLSGRESEVLALICRGLSNQEISERAYIGINTVKTYIRSCYRKIDAETRPQAVIWGLSHGFDRATLRIRREDPTADH